MEREREVKKVIEIDSKTEDCALHLHTMLHRHLEYTHRQESRQMHNIGQELSGKDWPGVMEGLVSKGHTF